MVFAYKLVKWFGQLLLFRYLCMNRVRWGCPISSYTILEYKANACWPTKSAHLFLSLFLVIQTPKRILCVHTLHDLDSKHVWEQIHGATNSTSINVRRSWVTSRLHHHGIAPCGFTKSPLSFSLISLGYYKTLSLRLWQL